ncbi:leucine-rich repeat flightless-interacting protein 1 isoform X6 [Phascolarctos cinereus]|uniref:Leucine-rich repeat flightless-interacting protein 1 isoform X6 n=1 Tax=Phascolarctos cinereus TaxID=38626 RepID=A0A6P5J0F3_PHACI|nr:leucine-rich repeat flightless-interacting protein 1 isoform X6 [Phascolarctos cinereus]
MEMGTQGSGRRRLPQRERLTAEDDALSQIAREAEARLAAKRAARAEAREIRMKELERQQKEIYQVQKKYYGLDTKWGDIEQWMEESERYSHRFRRNPSASDEDERMSVGSRGSLRSQATLDYAGAYPALCLFSLSQQTNGYNGDLYGSSSLNRKSSRGSYYSDLGLSCTSLPSRPLSASQNGARSSFLYRDVKAAWRYRASLYDESIYSGSRRYSASNSHPPSEYSGYLGSGSRASSRASSARASPVVEERPEKDFAEKGSRNMPSLSAATLASLGGTSSRRGSGDTSISVDTEASMREIKEINELKDQIQDVEGKYMQGLKEMKDSLAEVEEKYKKAMVSNAQLDNEKTNFMYQVDTLKDALLELEEQLVESRRQYEEKNKEFERQKHAHSVLQFQFAEAKEALKQREEMLAEIRQLQQKQESYIREISDLQETIEWKDKKIGALERQKEYFDSIRSERDELRAEAILLKEELKKHGIILNSEITTNGEPLDNLSNMSHLGSPKVLQQETNVIKSSSDGTLGRASEVEVASENVDKVGEREQPQADSAEAGVDTKALPPDGNAEAETPSQDHAMVTETLANDPAHVPETHSVPENTNEQVEPSEGGDSLGASVEPNHLSELESDNIDQNQEPAGSPHFPGDVISQDRRSPLDTQNEKKELVEKHEEGSRKLSQDTERIDTVKLSENHSESLLEGMEAKDRTQGDTEVDSRRTEDEAVSGDEKGASLMKGEQNKEEEREFIKGEQIQTIPSSEVKGSQPEKVGKRVTTGENECSDQNVPTTERDGQKREICDSSSKKSKNKKKKNKKKKSPPVGSSDDVKKELVFQNTEEEEDEEEEEVKFEAKNQAQDTLGKVVQEEKPEPRTDLDKYVDCPEEAKAELDDKPNQQVGKAETPERAVADDSKVSELDSDAAHPAGGKGEVSPSEVAEAGSIEEESVPAQKATEQSQMSKPENKEAVGSGPQNEDASSSPNDSSPTESMEENCEQSDEHLETAEEALESSSPDSDEHEDPVGNLKAESKEDTKGRTGKGKDRNKEECTMS